MALVDDFGRRVRTVAVTVGLEIYGHDWYWY